MVSVINKTNQTLIAHTVKLAHSPWTRFTGLMGKPSLMKDSALWILPCNSIHSFFMRFEFDAIFIDKHYVVVHTLEKMKPWRLSPLVFKAHSVIELNAGVIKETQTAIGHQLAL